MKPGYLQQFALLTISSVTILMSQPARAQPVTTAAGPQNSPLYNGAQAFQAGHTEEGVRLTLEGLSQARNKREEEAALSNLCTGYLRLREFDSALNYCNMLIERNRNAWRAYNSRAMIFLEQKEYEKADQDLSRAEAINPGARTLRIARALYMDTVQPVEEAVEIDDRDQRGEPEDDE